jgi:hypothetical protein
VQGFVNKLNTLPTSAPQQPLAHGESYPIRFIRAFCRNAQIDSLIFVKKPKRRICGRVSYRTTAISAIAIALFLVFDYAEKSEYGSVASGL